MHICLSRILRQLLFTIVDVINYFATQGLCHRLAVEKGIRHGRLPIGENIDMKTRKVLTIDHGKTVNLY